MTNSEIKGIVEQRQALAEQRDLLDEQIKDLTAQIGAELVVRDTPRLTIGEWTAQIVEQDRETLSKIRLLEAGVTPDQIQKGTEKKHSSFVTVRRASKKDREGE